MGSVSPHYIAGAAQQLYKTAVCTAAGSSMTGTTEAVMDEYTIPAADLEVGSLIRVTAIGTVSDGGGTSTATYRLRLGPSTTALTSRFVMLESHNLNPADDDAWYIEAKGLLYASGSMVGGGYALQGPLAEGLTTATTQAASTYRMTPTAVDLGVDNILSLTCDWSTTGDTTNIDALIVEITKKPAVTF